MMKNNLTEKDWYFWIKSLSEEDHNKINKVRHIITRQEDDIQLRSGSYMSSWIYFSYCQRMTKEDYIKNNDPFNSTNVNVFDFYKI